MKKNTPFDDFHSDAYLHHNRCRFEHLRSLILQIEDKSILEVGAAIGDHTEFLLNLKPSKILSLEAREENINILMSRFSDQVKVDTKLFDMDRPVSLDRSYDICYCYGLLYHLSKPGKALEFMAKHTRNLLLLETCVSYGEENTVNPVDEDVSVYSQSYTGKGCRPGRVWIHKMLKKYFDYVYMPVMQPDHQQFPTQWNLNEAPSGLTRAIFVASKTKLENPNLSLEILYRQEKIRNVCI